MKPGRKKGQTKGDIDMMALWALLVERAYDAEPKPAASAAITAFFTWKDYPHPELQVDAHLGAVQKAVQRIKRGKRDPSKPIELTVLVLLKHFKQTGERFVGVPEKIAAEVAKFLP